MLYALAPLALAAVVSALPTTPTASAPAGCSTNYDGTFEIQVVNVTSANNAKRDLSKRAAVMIDLKDGVLTDAKGRTGNIAANHQFQFDDPVQKAAIYDAGWSVCSNGSLALGDDAIFYQCLSGDFYNLYNENIGDQCSPVYIDVIAPGSTAVASAIPDGQVTASAVASQQSDGQVTAASAGKVTQISDGQLQASTAVSAAITQISDGQVQAPTSTSYAAVTQISDGQIQAPTANPVTQISDGQIQAPMQTPVTPVTQISDGQIQAPATGTGYMSGNSTAKPSPYTGAAGAIETSFGLGFGAFLLSFLL